MEWFEQFLEEAYDPDDKRPGSNPWSIAKIADRIDEEVWADFVRDQYRTQKRFGEFLGVGESTVAGWMKSNSFPEYARRAALSAYFAGKYSSEMQEAKLDAERPKVVTDGDSYLIVQFEMDSAGVEFGKVVARDIPTEKAALMLASGRRAWELLREAEQVLDFEVERDVGGPSDWAAEIKEKIGGERARVFAHDKLLEISRKELTLEDLIDRFKERKNLEETLDLMSQHSEEETPKKATSKRRKAND